MRKREDTCRFFPAKSTGSRAFVLSVSNARLARLGILLRLPHPLTRNLIKAHFVSVREKETWSPPFKQSIVFKMKQSIFNLTGIDRWESLDKQEFCKKMANQVRIFVPETQEPRTTMQSDVSKSRPSVGRNLDSPCAQNLNLVRPRLAANIR
jgi:hypothetical protein